MTHLPQIIIATWLTFAVIAGTSAAVFKRTRPVMLRPRHQRWAAAGFALAAAGEAVTLWKGGFFS